MSEHTTPVTSPVPTRREDIYEELISALNNARHPTVPNNTRAVAAAIDRLIDLRMSQALSEFNDAMHMRLMAMKQRRRG